ncbi:MAG: magnesium/cobalt transporter CorA [Longimicrobiales bacterium]
MTRIQRLIQTTGEGNLSNKSADEIEGAPDAPELERAPTTLREAARPEGNPEVRAWLLTPTSMESIPFDAAAERVRAAPVPNELVVIDVLHPGDAEAEQLREALKLHPLAVEDVMRGRQRPKLDRYPRHFFVVFYGATINPERRRVAFREMHVFIGTHFLVTASHYSIAEIHELVAQCKHRPARFRTIGGLVHGLLDAIVDDYFPIVHDFSEKVTRLENETIQGNSQGTLQGVVGVRRELILFRRVVAPERDVVGTALRRDIMVLEPELVPYFQDLRDHLERLTEEIDTLRELLSTVVEARVSAASNSLNQTIRIMTSWSIILMSMAVIAGIYGMNFVHMPELDWRFGYGFALALMIAAGLGLFTYFRRRGWI